MEKKYISDFSKLSQFYKSNITKNEICVFYFSLQLKLEKCNKFYRFLSPDEKEKYQRYHSKEDALRYVMGRGIIRILLGGYTGIAPEDLEFEYSQKGKPTLKSTRNRNKICFNLSHSAEALVVAITVDREVGIDIEEIKELPEEELLARQFFTPLEYERYRYMKERNDLKAFYKCWTRKEAYVKATGEGLTGAFIESDIQFCEGAETILPAREGKCWILKDLSVTHDMAAALCVEGRSWQTVIHYFQADEVDINI
ncbi:MULTISPECIES: 4'-phosphopantetheinyl transferase superfamily protein [unclassified Bacillus (in: firmicutes)]|uniref:4'-phosphopantetheinyl transferase family protein n=1 Tax=unclassified Bacillus (in: firmicutes) TaxID=185979 RepID=UPI000BF364D7|nr:MULTISPECIES: 4'-phosphopantetheinyl transferase superfamily protein [unclassified Bacillus (in: firmicutes)]PEU19244.1 hypothetical protein CN525_08220 [Bacillus sp. AFS014408]PFW62158.1 hypothetical protein COL20_14280 [Bacillus sp. AFS075034]